MSFTSKSTKSNGMVDKTAHSFLLLRMRQLWQARIHALTTTGTDGSLASVLMRYSTAFSTLAPKILPVVITALLIVSCSEQKREAETAKRDSVATVQSYSVKGTVRELKPDGRTIMIRHEEIPGYMDAMTMPFRVRGTNELAGLKAGDEVSFRLQVTGDSSWIDHVQRTGKTAALDVPTPTPASPTNEPGVFRLESIPDFALTNEFAQPVSLRQFKGQVLAMTFFFTRCPIPEYCPRLAKNFQGAVTKLKATPGGPTNFHFLSISFDPIDTPPVLRTYARSYGYDSNHWSFITGNAEQIQELARGFGVAVKLEGGTYDHGFSTAIFDATGKLQNMWPIGGDMTGQIVSEIVKGARMEYKVP